MGFQARAELCTIHTTRRPQARKNPAAVGRRRAAGDDAGNAAADDGRTTDAGTVSRDGDHARDRVIAEFVTDVRAETTDEVVPAAGETEEDAAHGWGGERGARVRGGRRR